MDNEAIGADPLVCNQQIARQKRTLELELIQLKHEAAAARLAARAAEIELMIRQLDDGLFFSNGAAKLMDDWASRFGSANQAPSPGHRGGWTSDRSNLKAKHDVHTAAASIRTVSQNQSVHQQVADFDQPNQLINADSDSNAFRPVKAPSRVKNCDQGTRSRLELKNAEKAVQAAGFKIDTPAAAPSRVRSAKRTKLATTAGSGRAMLRLRPSNGGKRFYRRRSGWMLSGFAHLGLLFSLAIIGFRTPEKREQLAFSAVMSESNDQLLESVSIEKIEPNLDAIANETLEEANEIPDLSSPEVAVGFESLTNTLTQTVLTQELTQELTQDSLGATQTQPASEMALEISGKAKSQFCGLEGGGNHFVYLVDSSKSMGSRFDSARLEVLESVDALQPNQRFYVIFFDAKPSYMRWGENIEFESTSAYATEENKANLREWAMAIEPDAGRAPYDAIRFALNLRPDAIFLLSDGKFPQGIEDLLSQENRMQNLFGEQRPISIVNTIAYQSKSGEDRMRRIAMQNHGQYRYISGP